MHLGRALTLTEKLSLLAQLFVSDYIISEQGCYKYLVVPLNSGKNNHQKRGQHIFTQHYLTYPTAIINMLQGIPTIGCL